MSCSYFGLVQSSIGLWSSAVFQCG